MIRIIIGLILFTVFAQAGTGGGGIPFIAIPLIIVFIVQYKKERWYMMGFILFVLAYGLMARYFPEILLLSFLIYLFLGEKINKLIRTIHGRTTSTSK